MKKQFQFPAWSEAVAREARRLLNGGPELGSSIMFGERSQLLSQMVTEVRKHNPSDLDYSDYEEGDLFSDLEDRIPALLARAAMDQVAC